jgi:radical SAM superfamily enzyme YgiQ (UPF0313 family)
MKAKRVTLVELSVYENTVPLVSGYLQAYACQDQEIAETYDFDIYSRGLRDDLDELEENLVERESHIYAFSCYIWNMGVVRKLLGRLLKRRPDAFYLLGGPQVMNRAAEYMTPEHPRVVVCNGEGEQPFYEFLRTMATDEPDLSQVSSVSYWSDGEIRTSSGAPPPTPRSTSSTRTASEPTSSGSAGTASRASSSRTPTGACPRATSS